MRQIKVKELTNDNFRKYGQFYSLTNPSGNHLGDFFQDKVIAENGSTMPVAFFSYVVRHTDRMIVTAAEYHDMACENFRKGLINQIVLCLPMMKKIRWKLSGKIKIIEKIL